MKFVIILLVLYVVICGLLYLFQEKLIFFPRKLDRQYRFSFSGRFEEISIKTSDNSLLSGILFRADSTKGVIYYLHGNAGALDSWGHAARIYTDLHYDVFMLDYRGYGKSEGHITNQHQFFDDVQAAYDTLKTMYDEDKIIVLAYSLGSAAGTKLASLNSPRLLVLQAPYFSLTDMMRHTYSIIPTFILKYKFETHKFIRDCKMPIIVFHGDQDEVIYYGSSTKLKGLMKQSDTLITLEGQGHNGMTDNPHYQAAMKDILSRN